MARLIAALSIATLALSLRVAAGTPLNGYEVAKRSGVPRSTVYETLAKLVGRGAAYEVREPCCPAT